MKTLKLEMIKEELDLGVQWERLIYNSPSMRC